MTLRPLMQTVLKIGGSLVLSAVPGITESASLLSDYSTNEVAITAGFIPDSSRIMIGEPVFVSFVVSNRADHPFHFSHVRNEIFTITATNAVGIPAKNLYFGMDGNGFVSQVTVPNGKVYTSRLFLNERCEFDKPGDYTVTCSCNFGYFGNPSNSLGRPIVTVFNLTVLAFDPERLTQIIDTWGHVVETNGALHEAAQALAAVKDPRTIPYLAVLVAKGSDVNYIAVKALTSYTNTAAADALAMALNSGEDYVANLAGTTLRHLHQADRAARTFLPALTNADANVRIQNARAVSWTGSELAFAPLCALLRDDSNSVRYAAAQAIGTLGDSRGFAVLTNCLGKSDFALHIAAVKGLLALGRPLQPAWLTPVIQTVTDLNDQNFHEAIRLIRMYGGDKAAPALVSCLNFDDPSPRNSRNMFLILAIHYSPGGPQYYYRFHSDPNTDGTPEQREENGKILSDMKQWLAQTGMRVRTGRFRSDTGVWTVVKSNP